MGNIERFGVFLPSFVWAEDGPERAGNIRDFARHVEDLGFDSVVLSDATATRALPSASGSGSVPAATLHEAALAALADRFSVVAPAAALG